jgi:DNA-binding GntR family transcriptional regulator
VARGQPSHRGFLPVHRVLPPGSRLTEPYLAHNREILDRLEAGDPTGAAGLLMTYLDDADQQLVAAYRQRTGAGL